jgi:hypothetical protein
MRKQGRAFSLMSSSFNGSLMFYNREALGLWIIMIVLCYNPWGFLMPKFHKHSFLYHKCWAFLVHYACFMLPFMRFFHAQASQTLIFVLQMLGILDSFFSMYIFYFCMKVQWYLIFPLALSICLFVGFIKNVTNVVPITI